MSAKQLAQRISISIIIIIAGLIILLDQLGVFGISALPQWYLIILMALALICLIISIINKAYLYLWFAFLLGGIYLALDLAINNNYTGFKETWPIIFISLGVGLLLSLIIKRSKTTAFIGVSLLTIFIPTMLGIWTETWTAILPILMLLFGLTTLGYSIYSAVKHTKFSIKDEDYYVRPSTENNADNNGQSDTIVETADVPTESANTIDNLAVANQLDTNIEAHSLAENSDNDIDLKRENKKIDKKDLGK